MPSPTTPNVHLVVLLDRSGSMASMAEQVVRGFNRLLADQLADGADALVTLIQFDDVEPLEVVADAVPVLEVLPLTRRTFEPRGATPLLDATGRAVALVSGRQADLVGQGRADERVLFVTITDGEENESREFTRHQIVELVQAKEQAGWTFVFLGAGLDAYAEAGGLGYHAGSVQSWAPDGSGADLAFASLSAKTRDYRAKVRRREAVDAAMFFEGDKPAEQDRRERGADGG